MWLLIACVVGVTWCCPFSGPIYFPRDELYYGDNSSSKAIICDPTYKYRSFNGCCNNLDHPTWGMVNTMLSRLSPARYDDNRTVLRKAKNGKELPNARELSLKFWKDKNVPDCLNLIVMQVLQLVAHDVILSRRQTKNVDDCCGDNINNTLGCAPIFIAKNDPFYSQYNVTCRSMTRTATSYTKGCQSALPMQQVNGVTHYIDGSLIYGSNSITADSFREKIGGRMRSNTIRNRDFLPPANSNTCHSSRSCYTAGDVRVNQNPQLTIMQTILLRNHNRIARKLATINPKWNDEKLYQESRAISIACLQHIIYKEFLPIIINKDDYKKYKLKPKLGGYTVHQKELPLTTFNEFATGAWRVLHSAIQGQLNLVDHSRNIVGRINISDHMNKPEIIEESENFDRLLLGLITQQMQSVDQYVTNEMNGKLFHFSKPYGDDLTALDIQRGRDHGIAPYIELLKICTGIEITCFLDLYQVMPLDAIIKIDEMYDSWEDIDLFVGGSLETKPIGARSGPTFSCINAKQFSIYKERDRFWYENRGQPHTMTIRQLRQIRKGASFARMFCDNGDNIQEIQKNVLYSSSKRNPIVHCTKIPEVDLRAWKE